MTGVMYLRSGEIEFWLIGSGVGQWSPRALDIPAPRHGLVNFGLEKSVPVCADARLHRPAPQQWAARFPTWYRISAQPRGRGCRTTRGPLNPCNQSSFPPGGGPWRRKQLPEPGKLDESRRLRAML